MSNKQVIIVAAGKGSRMGGDIPKQFLLLGGRPVIMHSIEAFYQFNKQIQIVLVLAADQLQEWEELKDKYSFVIKHQVVTGGATRFQSVGKGLEAIPEEGIVAIHDGVRPLVSPSTIARLFAAAEKKNSAIPYSPPVDSVRIERKDTSVIIDRSSVRMIQTPQVFGTRTLKQAYRLKEQSFFTDDASVFERAGGKIHLVECPAGNIKITRQEDLQVAEALIKRRG